MGRNGIFLLEIGNLWAFKHRFRFCLFFCSWQNTLLLNLAFDFRLAILEKNLLDVLCCAAVRGEAQLKMILNWLMNFSY
jgi:hypothetical protein